ncbi:Calx-beta domain-containing protein [uncultured Draconibacterium sp.]|uniref:Calx-beta domain-containing protein n=1 Tax=uncultured Draconibacterium sp. TaxID=1573823 RepID=UPI0032602E30
MWSIVEHQQYAGNRRGQPGDSHDNDNDSAELSVSDRSVSEGGNLLFTVALSGDVQGSFTIDYASNDVTASSIGSIDYAASTGSLSFSGTDGEIKTISISSTNNNILEPDESFELNFTDISNELVSLMPRLLVR